MHDLGARVRLAPVVVHQESESDWSLVRMLRGGEYREVMQRASAEEEHMTLSAVLRLD
jgi:hypothetical protein